METDSPLRAPHVRVGAGALTRPAAPCAAPSVSIARMPGRGRPALGLHLGSSAVFQLASILIVLTLVTNGHAQTVRPVINELSNPAKGRVEYVNDSITPLNVVLEPRSFSVSETGEISYRPL